MKKYYTLILVLFTTICAFGQIPNPSFENWTSGSGYEDPTGWVTPNSITVNEGGSAEVTKNDTAYGGNFAARLETDSLKIASVTIPGFVLLGNINIIKQSITGGIPFSGRPDTLYGYYKYTPANGKTDSCLAFIYLTHWNTSTSKRDTVVAGAFVSGATVTNYTKFSITLNYNYFPHGGETPDTLQLAISSSYKFLSNPPAGSIMFVDSLTFSADTTAGIKSLFDKGFSVSCYPNPANNNLNVLISEPKNGMSIKVYDVLGKNLLSTNNEGMITSIDVSNLSTGTYFFEVLDNNGNLLKTQKFNVVK